MTLLSFLYDIADVCTEDNANSVIINENRQASCDNAPIDIRKENAYNSIIEHKFYILKIKKKSLMTLVKPQSGFGTSK